MAITVKDPVVRNEIRDLVIDNWKAMKRERAEREEKWKRCVMSYLCEFDKKWVEFAKAAKRSHRYVNLNGDAVETVTPQIVDAVFGVEDWLQVEPLITGYDQNDDLYAEQMRALAKYQMKYGKFRQTAMLGAKQMLMVGNCPWTMNWKVVKAPDFGRTNEAMERWLEETAEYHAEFQQVKDQYAEVVKQSLILGQDRPPMPEFAPPPQPPVEMDTIFQGPVLSLFSIFNYVQEQHPNDEFSSLRIARSWRTAAHLKKFGKPDETGYRMYENLSNMQETSSEDREGDNDAESLLKMALGLEMPHGKDKHMVLEQHGTFESKSGKVYENYIATVAGGALVRCEPSPMYSGRPQLNNARLIKMHGDPYGTGIIEKALDEQDSANAIHNQNIDAVACVIAPEMEVDEDKLADGEVRPSGPGVMHFVTEQGAFNPIQKNFQGLPFGFESLNAAIARHERITGAINTSGRSEESATRTARNTNIIAGKLGSHVVALEDELINEALNIGFEMNSQYLTTEQIVSITQDGRMQQIRVDPAAIRRGWMVYSAGSKHLAEREQRIERLMMATQMAEQRGASGMPSPVRETKLWQLLFREILGDEGGLVMGEEEYQALIQQRQQEDLLRMAQEAAISGQQAGSGDQGVGAGGAPQNANGPAGGAAGPAN